MILKRYIFYGDISNIYRQKKKQLFLFAFAFAFITFFLIALSPLLFEAKATFKEAASTQESSSMSMVKQLFHQVGYKDEEHATASVMASRKCIYEVVKKLGLQVEVKRPLFSQLFHRIKEHVLFQIGIWPSADEDFGFRNVVYDREVPVKVSIRCLSSKSFEIDGKEVQVGQKAKFEGIEFTLTRLPKSLACISHKLCSEVKQPVISGEPNVIDGKVCKPFRKNTLSSDYPEVCEKCRLKKGKKYFLFFAPKEITIDKVLGRLKIQPRTNQKNILELIFSHKSPLIAKDFPNLLMKQYKLSLANEYKQIALAQIGYLENRQEEIAKTFEGHLEEHMGYLQKNLGDNGFMNLNGELYFARERKKKYSDRILELDLHMDKQRQYASSQEEGLGEIGETLRSLRMKKEELTRNFPDDEEMEENPHPLYVQEEFSQREELLSKLLNIEIEKELPPKKVSSHKKQLMLFSHPLFSSLKVNDVEILNRKISNISYRLKKEKDPIQIKKLETRLDHCKLKKYLLDERSMHHISSPVQFDGMDLDTAKMVAVNAQNDLSKTEGKIHQLEYVKNALEKQADFELSALGAFLNDPLGQELVKKAGDLMHRLRDEKNLMPKDRSRLQDALSKAKNSLVNHIKHHITLENINKEVFQEKIHKLNLLTFDLINQQLFLIENQAKNINIEKIQHLQFEKDLIENKIHELQGMMQFLPEKWLMENRLQFKTEMIMNLIEGISHLVESKNVEYHLKQIESNPLDFAYLPRKPNTDFLWFFSLLGGGFGCFVGLSFYLSKRMAKGLPVSRDFLLHLEKRVMPSLSMHTHQERLKDLRKEDLQILRKINGVLNRKVGKKALHVALLCNQGPYYVSSLAPLLTLSKKKVLHFSCDNTPSKKRATAHKVGVDALEARPKSRQVCEEFIAKAPWTTNKIGESAGRSPRESPQLDERLPKRGWIQFLEEDIGDLPIVSCEGYDVLLPGKKDAFAMEKWNSPRFEQLIEKIDHHYDVVLFSSTSPLDSFQVEEILSQSEMAVITLGDERQDSLLSCFAWSDNPDHKAIFLSSY